VLQLLPVAAQSPAGTDAPAALPPVAEGDWYIVEFEGAPLATFAKSDVALSSMTVGKKLNVNALSSQAYVSALKTQQAQFGVSLADAIPGAEVARGYQIVLNAVAVRLPNSNRATLKALMSMPGVKRISPQRIYTVEMDYSLPIINAEAMWTQLGGQDAAGAGVKIAIVDTGIDPDHPFFDGTGWSYPETGTWPKGYCADHAGFCNGKIIAARAYPPTFDVNVNEVLTPDDREDHGTHVAGSAAGNRITADFAGSPELSGAAPGAWLMVYKGLYLNAAGDNGTGSNIMLAGAIEDAIADGADIVNNSWGSAAITPHADDPITKAYEAAVDAGIVVVFSIGNAGPDHNTAGNPSSPKFIEVGASTTERVFYNELSITAPEPVTDTLQAFPGVEFSDIAPTAIPTTTIGPLPYIPTDLTGNPDMTLAGVYEGITQTAPYDSGWIALIPRGDFAFIVKLGNTIRHGASAVAMYTDDRDWRGGFTAGNLDIYTVMFDHDIGLTARDWWATYTDTARLQIGYPFAPYVIQTPDVIADFSSRGPNLDLDIKPDVVAPGVNILSGTWDGGFRAAGGTSQAAPHVSGAAALLLQMHPDWTPAQVKSALMSTASQTVLELDEVTTANVMTQGAGRIDLTNVGDPGLTFDKPSISFGMVSQGLDTSGTTTLRVCGTKSVLVTATDVSGAGGSYSVDIEETVFDSGYVTITVETDEGTLSSSGGTLVFPDGTILLPGGNTAEFTVTVEACPGATAQDVEGNILLSDGSRTLHVPYWARVVPLTTAEVLVVDMDAYEIDQVFFGGEQGWGSYNDYYTSALDAMGVAYDYWDAWTAPTWLPDRSVLDLYDKVIYFTGDNGQFGFANLGEPSALSSYLANGGKLLITGQDASGNDGLRNVMRGANANPLSDTVYGPYITPPPSPSGVGVGDLNPFLQGVVFDMSVGPGDGADNQLFVDEVDWLNFAELDTAPLFEAPNTSTALIEDGYMATRSSFEPTIERVQDTIGVEPFFWRVAFLAFGLEGVNNDTGYATREDLLGLIFDWMDDEITVAFDEAAYEIPAPFGLVNFEAVMSSTVGAEAVLYRWDYGDGSDIDVTTDPTTSHQYIYNGIYYAYVEVVDEYGHGAVSGPIRVTVGNNVFLPLMIRYSAAP
jgi:subtilisin family serine protease